MKTRGRWLIFSLVAAIAYTLAYYFDWPLFQYYPVENRFHFSAQGPEAGPPILWYGWLAMAALAGAAAAILVPVRWTARLPADLVWLVPSVLIVATLMYEQRWFP